MTVLSGKAHNVKYSAGLDSVVVLFAIAIICAMLIPCIANAADDDTVVAVDFTMEFEGRDARDEKVQPLLGVISGPVPCYHSVAPDLTAHLQDIGIITIRNNDYWSDTMDMEYMFNCCNPDDPWDSSCPDYPSWEGCNPDDPSNYNWSSSDMLYNSWMEGGFEPFLRLGGEHQCGGRPHSFLGPQNETQENNWIEAAVKVVDRYLNWPGHNNAFSYVDIWTEWPNKNFYDGSNHRFILFWTSALKRLKDAFPELKIGGPGFLGQSVIDVMNGENGMATELLENLFNEGVMPHWIGWHFWTQTPDTYLRIEQQFRDLLDGTGDFAHVAWAGSGFFDDTELVVDAYGYSTTYQRDDGALVDLPREQLDEICNHSKGAAVLTGIWIALQHTDIKRAYYYRAGDANSDPNADWRDPDTPIGGTGLFFGDVEGTYKPTANAVRLWSRVVNEFPFKLAGERQYTDESGKELWVLASEDGNGRRAILLSNISGLSVNYNIRFSSGKELKDFANVQIYNVTDIDAGRNARDGTGSSVTIAPYSVQLLIMEMQDAAVSECDTICDTMPVPDIKANGADSGITLHEGESLNLAISLDAGCLTGCQGDWWAVEYVNSGLYYYDVHKINMIDFDPWTSGLSVAYQGPLFSFSTLSLFETDTLPAGAYTFYFGVDLSANGILDDDSLFYDSVEVKIE